MFFAFCEINATKFGAENEVTHKIIMQWKKSYYIASNVSSRKGATTFGDLPDWSLYSFSYPSLIWNGSNATTFVRRTIHNEFIQLVHVFPIVLYPINTWVVISRCGLLKESMMIIYVIIAFCVSFRAL